MPKLQTTPDLRPSNGGATHEYLVDMISQLAELARGSGDVQIAIILEAAIASDSAARINDATTI